MQEKVTLLSGASEHSIQNAIRLKLSEMGYCVFRANVGKVKTADGRWFDTGLQPGFSDLFAIKDGRICFIEVKKPGGAIRDCQKQFLKVMHDRYGCPGGIAYSVEDAVNIVKLAEMNKLNSL